MPDEDDTSSTADAEEEVEDEEVSEAQWAVTPKGKAMLGEGKREKEKAE